MKNTTMKSILAAVALTVAFSSMALAQCPSGSICVNPAWPMPQKVQALAPYFYFNSQEDTFPVSMQTFYQGTTMYNDSTYAAISSIPSNANDGLVAATGGGTTSSASYFIKPNSSIRSRASMMRPADAFCRSPKAAIRPSFTATSARNQGLPLPSITRALRIRMS
jgi:hypothetical protein